MALKAAVVGVVAGCFFLLVCTGQGQSLRSTTSSRPGTTSATTQAQVSEKDFMKVMDQHCVGCHRNQCKSVQDLEKVHWLVPGKPEASPVYKVIGVHKNPKGIYHNMPAADKQVIFDFIKQMKAN
jgi:mono/diheme cytochrome c family protein